MTRQSQPTISPSQPVVRKLALSKKTLDLLNEHVAEAHQFYGAC
jgi:hypothetical protein